MEILKNFEHHFDSQRLKDGKEYFKMGLVRNVMINDSLISAIVRGNSAYRVKLDLKKQFFSCTCPCDFNCKHEAALFYYLRDNNVDNSSQILSILNTKSKKELIEIIQKLATSNPQVLTMLNPNNQNVEKQIKQLWLRYESDLESFYLKFDNLLKTIKLKENRKELLLQLFRRLIDLSDHGWNNEQELDDCSAEVLTLLNRELKNMDKLEARKLKKEIKTIVAYQDYLLDYID